MHFPEHISYGYLLQKAWPLILANAAVPLLGLVDSAVIGNVGQVADLGAIAFGALIFSFAYWGFGFLRMGTTAFVAQAAGAGDERGVRAVLGRALGLGFGLGCLLILMQGPIQWLAFAVLEGSGEVEAKAGEYFSVRIWGAPATLATFSLMGLLIGLGQSRRLLAVQLFLNGLNAGLDVLFAGVLDWGVRGIAMGTVVAEWSTLVLACYLIYADLNSRRLPGESFWDLAEILDPLALRRTLLANTDIMVRTLILVFSFAFFASQSARFGDQVLAANHLLMQLIAFAAFFLDGFAFVAEALVGSAVGAARRDSFDVAVRRTTVLALLAACFLATLLLLFGEGLIALLTDLSPVRIQAGELLWLAAIYVAVSFAAFQLDGIFIGAARTAQMRNAAIVSIACYLGLWALLIEPMGVQGLWWAMIGYVIARALALLYYFSALRRSFRP